MLACLLDVMLWKDDRLFMNLGSRFRVSLAFYPTVSLSLLSLAAAGARPAISALRQVSYRASSRRLYIDTQHSRYRSHSVMVIARNSLDSDSAARPAPYATIPLSSTSSSSPLFTPQSQPGVTGTSSASDSSGRPSSEGDLDSRFAEVDSVVVHHKLLPAEQSSDAVSKLPIAVCMHGFGANLFSFEVCRPLREHARVVAYDAPGFGLTSRPARLHYYTPRFSAIVARSLAHAYEPNGPYILVAHSMGAIAAAYAAIAHPREVIAVILIAPALLPASRAPPVVARTTRCVANGFAALSGALTAVLSPVLVPLLRLCVTPEHFWRAALKLARAPESPLPDEVIAGYRRAVTAPDWERGLLNFTRASLKDRAHSLQQDRDYVAILTSLGHAAPPILIVHGGKDKFVPLDNSVRLAEELPTASIVIMDNCGHVPHEEAPQQFSDVIADFLQSVYNANSTS